MYFLPGTFFIRVIPKPRSSLRSRFTTSSSPRGSFEVANLERNPERLHSIFSFEVPFHVAFEVLALTNHIQCRCGWLSARIGAHLALLFNNQSNANIMKANQMLCKFKDPIIFQILETDLKPNQMR